MFLRVRGCRYRESLMGVLYRGTNIFRFWSGLIIRSLSRKGPVPMIMPFGNLIRKIKK